jgi:hypothetical protein
MNALLEQRIARYGRVVAKSMLRILPADQQYAVLHSALWDRQRWLGLFGFPGAAAAGLTVLCLMFYISTIRPAQADFDTARKIAVSAQDRLKNAEYERAHGKLTAAEQLDAFYRAFPNDKNLMPLMEKIFSAARSQGIHLDRGEYQVFNDKAGRLLRYQLNLPVRSSYPQIRKFIDTVHAEIPTIALEHLQFERQKVGNSEVEAKIMLALYLEREP